MPALVLDDVGNVEIAFASKTVLAISSSRCEWQQNAAEIVLKTGQKWKMSDSEREDSLDMAWQCNCVDSPETVTCDCETLRGARLCLSSSIQIYYPFRIEKFLERIEQRQWLVGYAIYCATFILDFLHLSDALLSTRRRRSLHSSYKKFMSCDLQIQQVIQYALNTKIIWKSIKSR